MQEGKKPTEEIADMGKVILVPNRSYLFSIGTVILGLKIINVSVPINRLSTK